MTPEGDATRLLTMTSAMTSAMQARILVTVATLIYGLIVPILEINDTHVFNPEWPPHARLHEVWQLATNTALAVGCLWLAWRRTNIRLPAIIALVIMGGFLFAYLAKDSYGGSVVSSPTGDERQVVGISLAVVGALVAVTAAATAWFLDWRERQTADQ